MNHSVDTNISGGVLSVFESCGLILYTKFGVILMNFFQIVHCIIPTPGNLYSFFFNFMPNFIEVILTKK